MNADVKRKAKFTAHMVGSICGAFTAGSIIGMVIPNTGTVANIVIKIGSVCIGGIIGDKCGEYLENQVEVVCNLVDTCSNVTA